MGFKEYLNESLLVEAKVKVGGKEYASKKDAGIALAKLGKNAEQIEKATGLSLAGAKWCIAQVKKEDKEPVKNKAQERKEALDAYKKGEKYKPEPLELVPLDKEKSKSNAKEWMKKHGNDHLKKKDEMSPMMTAFHKELKQYEKLATKGKTPSERRYYKEMISRVKARIKKVEDGIPLNLDN